MFINGRAAIYKGCVGQAVAFPDVCLCPARSGNGRDFGTLAFQI